MVLTVHPAHLGAVWDPWQVPRAVMSQDAHVPGMLQSLLGFSEQEGL